MRPVLKPALRRLWRDERTLQLGVDPRTAVVLHGVGPTEARLLSAVDGTHDERGLLIAAAVLGVTPAAAQRLLTVLAEADLLDDASVRPPALATLPRSEQARLAPDRAALSLRRPGPGAAAAALATRHAAAVRVVGAGRLGAPLAALLAAAGVGHLDIDDPSAARASDAAPGGTRVSDAGLRRERAAEHAVARVAPSTGLGPLPAERRPDLVVLAGGVPDRAEQAALARAGLAHLCVAVRDTTGVVGPLVVPGRSACLRCLDLSRTERDPAWPVLAAQLTAPRTAHPRRSGAEPCDVVLASVVAGHAALEALAFLEAADPAQLATFGGTLELAPPDWRVRRRSWPPHPACGCHWPD